MCVCLPKRPSTAKKCQCDDCGPLTTAVGQTSPIYCNSVYLYFLDLQCSFSDDCVLIHICPSNTDFPRECSCFTVNRERNSEREQKVHTVGFLAYKDVVSSDWSRAIACISSLSLCLCPGKWTPPDACRLVICSGMACSAALCGPKSLSDAVTKRLKLCINDNTQTRKRKPHMSAYVWRQPQIYMYCYRIDSTSNIK